MTIISCKCGGRFQASAQLAGQQLACPRCGGTLQIPSAPNIQVRCSCGKAYSAVASLAGQRVRCSACGSMLRVPQAHRSPSRLTAPSAPDPLDVDLTTLAGSSPLLLRPSAKPSPGVPRWLLVAGAAALAVILLGIGGYATWQLLSNQVVKVQQLVEGTRDAEAAARRKVDDELARLRAAGEPTTPAQLERFYALPAGARDTTELWLSGAAPFFADQFDAAAAGIPLIDRSAEGAVPPPGQEWSELSRAQQLLRQYQQPLAQLHQAAEGAARYPTNFADPLHMDLSYAQALMAAARLLRLQAHVRMHEGDSAGAVEAITTVFAAGHTLGDLPNSIAQLVSWAIYTQAFQAVDALLPYVDFSEAELNRLAQAIEACDVERGLYRGFLGERVAGLYMIEHPEEYLKFWNESRLEDVPAFTDEQIEGLLRIAPLVRQRDRWFFLKYVGALVDASQAAWPERLKRLDQLASDWKRMAEQNKLRPEDFANLREGAAADRALLPHLITGGYETTLHFSAQIAARRDVAKAAIAVERYRNKYQRLPQSITEVVPDFLAAVPTDPFDGQPIRYARQPNHYVIYSIGKDKEDDQGHGTLTGNDLDIVFDAPLVNQLRPGDIAAARGRSGAASAGSPSRSANVPPQSSQPQRPSSPLVERARSGAPKASRVFGTPRGWKFEDLAPAGTYLVGLRVAMDERTQNIRGIQPLYRSSEEIIPGNWLGGTSDGDYEEALADQGYVVTGLRVETGEYIEGIRLIFTRVFGFDPDGLQKYESEWLGRNDGSSTFYSEFGRRVGHGFDGTFDQNLTSLRLLVTAPASP